MFLAIVRVAADGNNEGSDQAYNPRGPTTVEVTEVRIMLAPANDERLRAYCSITLDDAFVVRDIKILEGEKGLFIAMPSRRIMRHCDDCGHKNHLRAKYCNQCGRGLRAVELREHDGGVHSLYADIAHPIHAACREQLDRCILREFHLASRSLGASSPSRHAASVPQGFDPLA